MKLTRKILCCSCANNNQSKNKQEKQKLQLLSYDNYDHHEKKQLIVRERRSKVAVIVINIK